VTTSPQASYTDRTIAAAGETSANFRGYRVQHCQQLICVLQTGAAIISSKELLIYPHEAEWTPFRSINSQKIWYRLESNPRSHDL
jgi:hypothetical protein